MLSLSRWLPTFLQKSQLPVAALALWREAEDCKKECLESIGTLKSFLETTGENRVVDSRLVDCMVKKLKSILLDEANSDTWEAAAAEAFVLHCAENKTNFHNKR